MVAATSWITVETLDSAQASSKVYEPKARRNFECWLTEVRDHNQSA
jgi:hypothetical protein